MTFKLSRILSYLLHPLLLPTIALVTIMFTPQLNTVVLPGLFQFWFLGVVFIFTFAIPVAGMLILKKFKAIESIEINNRPERTIPLILSSTSFMAMLYAVKSQGIPPVYLYILYTATFSLLAGLLINMVYKISLHTLAWGSITAALISVSARLGQPDLGLIAVTIILAGLAGYARLKENAHNQSQVYWGYIAGALVIIIISSFE